MATWKKVIVSGSAAHLLNVTASNLTDDNLVIAGAGGALESSGLTYNGTLLNLGSSQVQAAGFSGSVYLMPVGGVESVYHLNNRTVAELAMKMGYRYSDRLQVPLFKNAWGT